MTICRDLVIITGCDTGIGLMLAEYFTTNHEHQLSVLACVLNTNKLSGYGKLIRLRKQNLHLLKVDVTSHDDITRLVGYVDELKNKSLVRNVLALINNAGVLVYGELHWQSMEHIERQINVNVLGTMMVTKGLLDCIIDDHGKVINITGVCKDLIFPGLTIYAPTKAAIGQFTRTLGYEMFKFDAHAIEVKLGDFIKQTEIMSANHEKSVREMWNNVITNHRNDNNGDVEAETPYKHYFQKYNHMIKQTAGLTGFKSFKDSNLDKVMAKLVFSNNPPTSVTVVPLKFKFIFDSVPYIPVKWVYWTLNNILRIFFKLSMKSE